MRQHVAVVDASELLRVVAETRAPSENHLEERLQMREVAAAVRRRIALLHVDVEVVVAVPRHELVILEPRTLEPRRNAVRIGHRAEAVHPVVEDALQNRFRNLDARARLPKFRPVVDGLGENLRK